MFEMEIDELRKFPGLVDYMNRSRRIKPARYGNIYRLILKNECRKLVEIGVFNAGNAKHMIDTAKIGNGYVHYIGFDLFEDLTEADLDDEFSKFPLTMDEAAELLANSGAKVDLVKGNTLNTLPASLDMIAAPDFVFIDGGHSHKTIESDWHNIQQVMTNRTIVLFDDYYLAGSRQLEGMGCNKLIDSLDREKYNVTFLHPADTFEKDWGPLGIQMVVVTHA